MMVFQWNVPLHTSEPIGMSKLQRNVIHATDQCVCVRVCIVACLPA